MYLLRHSGLLDIAIFSISLGSSFILATEAYGSETEVLVKSNDLNSRFNYTTKSESIVKDTTLYEERDQDVLLSPETDTILYVSDNTFSISERFSEYQFNGSTTRLGEFETQDSLSSPEVGAVSYAPDNTSSNLEGLSEYNVNNSTISLGELEINIASVSSAPLSIQTEKVTIPELPPANVFTLDNVSPVSKELSEYQLNESSTVLNKFESSIKFSSINTNVSNFQSEWSAQFPELSLQQSSNVRNDNQSFELATSLSISPYLSIRLGNIQILSSQLAQNIEKSSIISEIDSIIDEGNRQASKQQYKEAEKLFDQALQKAEKTGNLLGTAKALSGKAAVELGLERYETAENFSTKALVVLQGTAKKNPDIEADILLRKGYAYLGQEKKSELENLVEQLSPMMLALKESENSAGLFISLADLQYALGKKEQGNQSARKAVDFLQKNPNPSGAIAILSRLAVSQYIAEKSDETEKTLDQITLLIEKLKEQRQKVDLLQGIGKIYLKLGEAENLKIQTSEATKQKSVNTARGSFEKARQVFKTAEGLSKSEDSQLETKTGILLGLARAYQGLNRSDEAIEHAELALSFIKNSEKTAGTQETNKKKRSIIEKGVCWGEKIFTRSSSCDKEDAEQAILDQPNTLLKRMKRDAYNVIATAQLNQERYTESDTSLREALQITRELDGKLSKVSKVVRLFQAASGLIALTPIQFISDFGSYINATASGLDQLLILPQGGLSLLNKINTDLLSSSRKRKEISFDELRQKQEQTKEPNAKAEISLQLGSGYLSLGKYRDASRIFKDAALLFRELAKSGQTVENDGKTWAVKEAEALLGSGRSLYLERNYLEAQKVIQQAADIFQREGNTLGLANTWLTLGNIDLSQSRLSQSREKLLKALANFSKANDEKDAQIGEANTFLALGTVLLKQRKYKDALKYSEAAIGIFQTLRNETESARARLVRGSAYQSLGDHRKALEDAQKSLFIFKDQGDRLGEISALNNIGDALQSQRRYEQAIKFYGLSNELQKDLQQYIQKPREKTGWLVNAFRVGSFFLPIIGNLGRVGLKIHNALSIAQSVVYLSESATSNIGTGFSYLNQGEHKQAMDAFERVRSVSLKNNDPQKEAEALLGLSNTRLSFDKEKEYDIARNDAERAERLFSEIGDRTGASYALLTQGVVNNRIGNFQSDQQKKLESFRKSFSMLQRAIATFQDPEILDLDGEAQSYSALANLMVDQGQPQAAIVFYKRSIEITEQIQRNIPEGELRTVYVGKVVETHRRLINLLLSQARVPEAQKILELLKNQEIKEYRGVTRASINDNGEVEYIGVEKKIKEAYTSIIALSLKLAECSQNCKSFEDQRDLLISQFDELVKSIAKEIDNRKIGSDPLIYNPTSLNSDAKDIVSPCEKLGTQCSKAVKELNTMLIYPFIAEDEKDKTKYTLWLLWAAPQGVSVAVSRKLDRQFLEKTVFEFYNLVSTRGNLTELQQKGKQLHDWLIQPVEKELKDGKINNLVFVLDRFLRYIPMAALHDGNQYLIQKGYSISTIISAKDTDVTDRLSAEIKDTGILAMGLSKKKPGFAALEDVPTELERIVRRVSSDNKYDPTDSDGAYPGKVFLDSNFSLGNLTDNLGKESLQKHKYRILHIATHGKFVPGSDQSSFLVLGSGDEQTLQKLTIPQIDKNLQFRLSNIHLVILSACETALGANTKPANNKLDGLEIPGLSYSFIQKGRAKSVLASLWLVNSKTTASLMQSFYWNLANTKDPITKAEALRRSQMFILTGKSQASDIQRGFKIELAQPGSSSPIPDSSHPFYWAPFTLIGNGL
jgi:CHAT domain-containing protein/Tfp pilus assembly protein PilF